MENVKKLEGKWLLRDGKIEVDQTCRIIESRISEKLQRVTARDGGWTVLYHDPIEGSYWELTYQDSEMQGGGPPTLTYLEPGELQALYPTLSEQ